MMIKKAQKAGFMKYNQASWEIRMMRGKQLRSLQTDSEGKYLIDLIDICSFS